MPTPKKKTSVPQTWEGFTIGDLNDYAEAASSILASLQKDLEASKTFNSKTKNYTYDDDLSKSFNKYNHILYYINQERKRRLDLILTLAN